jgi:uncharacterized membrane protein
MAQTLADTEQTLYIAFQDGAQAERAAGALLDHGVRQEDLSVLVDAAATGELYEAADIERAAKTGISTTTAEDAGIGAAAGAGIGLGLGVLAGLAALVVPGVGLVYGAGALSTAIAAAAGTTAAGAVAGGVTGYLKDQGIPENSVRRYANYYQTGGALIELSLPSGNLSEMRAREIVAKYGGADVGSF